MRSYAQYCPVAKATEVLGDRWTLLIVREMLGGASGFDELQRGLPGISRSVLTDRMRALERAEVIERRTGPGHPRLPPHVSRTRPPAGRAGDRRVGCDLVVHRAAPRGTRSRPLDRMDGTARRSPRLPPNRTIVKLTFATPSGVTGWSSSPTQVSVCLQHPGFDVDLEVSVDTTTLYRVYLGRRTGQRDSSRPANDERPADPATRIRPLVHVEPHSPQPVARRMSAAQPPHDLPNLIACGSPKTAIGGADSYPRTEPFTSDETALGWDSIRPRAWKGAERQARKAPTRQTLRRGGGPRGGM